MRKLTAVIIGIPIVAILFLAGNAYVQKKNWSDGVAKLDEWTVIEGNEYNGGIGDIIIGNKDAKVKIIEYADFQCSACATTFPYIHEIVKEYGDEIAYIYRNYAINYHKNATAAGSAAVAAYLQGYFENFAETLFETQGDWFYSEGAERDQQFEDYFMAASDNKGNLEKFRQDIKSADVRNKLAVDREFAVRANLTGTPLIYINKEKFEVASSKESDFKSALKSRINAALEAAK